jgi:hypothetical protein
VLGVLPSLLGLLTGACISIVGKMLIAGCNIVFWDLGGQVSVLFMCLYLVLMVSSSGGHAQNMDPVL